MGVVEVRVIVVVGRGVTVIVVVSASAATTTLQEKRRTFFYGVDLSLHEEVILLQLEGVLSLRSGIISLLTLMTRVIPLRREMTHGSFCRWGSSCFCVTTAKTITISRFILQKPLKNTGTTLLLLFLTTISTFPDLAYT